MGMDRIIEKKRWTPRRVTTYSAVGVFVLAILYFLLFQSSASTLNVEASHLTISKVHRGPFQEFIPITGEVLPNTSIFMDTQEGGIVEKIYIQAGSRVKEGDAILKLSNTSLLMDIMYREAELFQQINNLRNTRLSYEQNRLSLERDLADADFQMHRGKRRFESYETLAKEGLIPSHDFEDARDEYKTLVSKYNLTKESLDKDLSLHDQQIVQLEDSVSRMQNNLEIARKKLDTLVIKAPITGVLTSLRAEVGQNRTPGERLGQIDAEDGFKVRAGIDEFYIDRIQNGQMGVCEVTGVTYKLMAQRVYPEVRDGKFEVDMRFDGKEAVGIRRGQTLHIRLELSDIAEALLLPRGGFFQKTGGNWVFVVEPDGKTASKRDIKLGRQNPDTFEVIDGLKAGEQVITSSYDGFGTNERLVLK